ncbi:MAG: hypothetical protein FWD54_02705 [Endomicrobia bacterium]|nr:hypothetical protein [Endomicrobiia bacterium]MCL2799174.1 hypothetical protein [Endomicrobiia bacterium]
MHDSNKLWVTFAVFIVVIGLLLGMYLTASPDKLLKNPKKIQQKKEQVKYKDTTPQQMALDQNTLPDQQKQIDLRQEIKDEDAALDNGSNLKADEAM